MKKLAVVFLALLSVSAFAALDLFGLKRAGSVDLFDLTRADGNKAMHFNGSGRFYDASKNMKAKYVVAVKFTPLAAKRTHVTWRITHDGGEDFYALILERNHELLTIYAPASAKNQHDVSTYVKAGYGYLAFGDDTSKQFIMMNYLHHSGNRHDGHMLVQYNKGRLSIDTNGTIGNDKDGMNVIWVDHVTQLDN